MASRGKARRREVGREQREAGDAGGGAAGTAGSGGGGARWVGLVAVGAVVLGGVLYVGTRGAGEQAGGAAAPATTATKATTPEAAAVPATTPAGMAAPATPPARRIDEKLASLVGGTNPKTGKPIDDIVDLVAALPAEMRSHFTFVHTSRSPAGGLGDRKQSTVDPMHPRAILYTPDARLVAAFVTNPDKPGYNTVEFLKFVDEEARFELTRFVLPAALRKAPNDPVLAAMARDNGLVNPEECARCHSADTRPLLDSYPLWPGFYGGHSDSFQSGTAELDNYKKFYAASKDLPLFAQLEWPKGTHLPPYIDPDYYDREATVGREEDLQRAPNSVLGMALSELNRKRIERKLAASPLYKKYRKGLLAVLLDCMPPPMQRADVEPVAVALAEDNRSRIERLGFTPKGPKGTYISLREMLHPANVAELLYMAKILQVDPRDWSMGLEDGALALYDGMLTGMYQGRSYYLKEDIILEMFRRLAREDGQLTRYFETWHASGKNYTFGEKLNFNYAMAACGALVEGQRATGNALPPIYEPLVARPPAPHTTGTGSELPACAAPGGPVARCIGCHEGEEAYNIGRALPLSDAALLGPMLNRRAFSSSRTLFEEILVRMKSHGPDRMPPHGDPATPSEIAEMQKYLESVRPKI